MKILIAYYSRAGNTEKIAEEIRRELEVRGHFVDIEKIKPLKEQSWIAWFFIRIFKKECEIYPPKIKDVSNYDAVCVGSPSRTRFLCPAAEYLKKIKGLKYKNIGFFSAANFLPQAGWHILSAYLFDLVFSKIVDKKEGRNMGTLFLSATFKKWNCLSNYGKREIKKFCTQMESPLLSFKDYFLKQNEAGSARLLAALLSLVLASSFIFQLISPAVGLQIFSWRDYFYLFIIVFFADIALLAMSVGRFGVFWGKYIAGMSLIIGLTIFNLFLTSFSGRSILLEYVLIFILVGFFHDLKAVLLTGLISVLGYSFLYFFYPQREVVELGLELEPVLDIPLLFLIVATISFVAQNLQKNQINLLKTQEEIEMAKAALEIKVAARTKELKELAGGLDEQVKEKTKELQEKIEELEKFNKLAVGRELRMAELKKALRQTQRETEELKEELEKIKGRE